MRDAAERSLGIRQQRVADSALGEIADKGNRELWLRGGLDRGGHPLLADIGKHRTHALTDQGQRDGAPDAVAGTGDQRRLARGIEGRVEQAHCVSLLYAGFVLVADETSPRFWRPNQ